VSDPFFSTDQIDIPCDIFDVMRKSHAVFGYYYYDDREWTYVHPFPISLGLLFNKQHINTLHPTCYTIHSVNSKCGKTPRGSHAQPLIRNPDPSIESAVAPRASA
jgi:hypothetical protein